MKGLNAWKNLIRSVLLVHKKIVDGLDIHVIKTKNNRYEMVGKCPISNHKVVKFITKKMYEKYK